MRMVRLPLGELAAKQTEEGGMKLACMGVPSSECSIGLRQIPVVPLSPLRGVPQGEPVYGRGLHLSQLAGLVC